MTKQKLVSFLSTAIYFIVLYNIYLITLNFLINLLTFLGTAYILPYHIYMVFYTL